MLLYPHHSIIKIEFRSTELEEPRTNRQKRAKETKAKIIAAAKKVIAEKGFDNVSIEDIAKQANVATGSFYTYFKRKEDIIDELNNNDFYRLAQLANEQQDADILDRLTYYCKKFLLTIEETGIEICRQWTKNNLSPTPMDIRGEKITKYDFDYRAMQQVLEKAVKRGELAQNTPIQDLALFFNAQLYGLMVAWCMTDSAIIGSQKVETFCKTIVKATLAPYRCNPT